MGIVGDRGSGKTLTMARTCIEMLQKGRTIYTNFHLNKNSINKKYHNKINLLDNEFFKNYKDMQLYNCCVFIDEVYVYIDSRSSMSKRNRIWSYFINQTRKRDVDLYFTTQFFRQVEIRLRMNTEFFILPTCLTDRQTGKTIIVNKILANRDILILIKEERFIANDYFNIYDTDEIITFEE